MKIKKLTIENFESHKNTVIEFDENFNCIIGPTNVGKTAIFNAIIFALFNEWDSDFLRKNEKLCKVILECDEFKLERIRGETENVVIIEKDGKTYKFDNFGKYYPKEVKSLLNISELENFLSCIAFQDNNSFLIYDTTVARNNYIDKIAGIDILENILKNIDTESKKLKDDICTLERQKFEVKKELYKLRLLEKLEKLALKLEKLEEKYIKQEKLLSVLKIYNDKLKSLQITKYIEALNLLPSDNFFDNVVLYIDQFIAIYDIYKKIENINLQIQYKNNELGQIDSLIEQKVSELINLLMSTKRCPLCGSQLESYMIDFIFKDFQ